MDSLKKNGITIYYSIFDSDDKKDLKIKIPIRATTNVKSPKVAVNNDTLNPPAKIAGSGSPRA